MLNNQLLLIVIGAVVLVAIIGIIFIVINRKKKKKKQMLEEEERLRIEREQQAKINPTDSQIYNPLKGNDYNSNHQAPNMFQFGDQPLNQEMGTLQYGNSSIPQGYMSVNNSTQPINSDKKKKKEKRKSKKEKMFDTEKNICIQQYNSLFTIYQKNGYPTDLETNDILAYYNQQITNAADIEELKNISTNLSFQINAISGEIESLRNKKETEERRKFLYDACVEYMVELENLFKLIDIDGKSTLQDFNSRLLNSSKFAGIDEYEKLYNELQYNISYMKERYKDVLVQHTSTNNEGEVDVRLVSCLKLLECDTNETDLSIVKKKYLKLIKKYHPDVNKDSSISIDMTSKLNEAYAYVQKVLK